MNFKVVIFNDNPYHPRSIKSCLERFRQVIKMRKGIIQLLVHCPLERPRVYSPIRNASSVYVAKTAQDPLLVVPVPKFMMRKPEAELINSEYITLYITNNHNNK